jgi:glycosyltransferase involved in cell wall biosynthesis
MRVVRPLQFNTRSQVINFLPYMLSALLALLSLRADVIHLYKPTPLTIVGVVGGMRRRTVLILDMDDLGSRVMARQGNPSWAVKLVAWCERRAACSSDGIVAASSFLKQRYEDLYPAKPILWVPNGAQRLFQSAPSPEQRIVFLGSIDNREVLSPLLQATREARNAHGINPRVHVIGDGAQRRYFESLADSMGIADSVQFHGWVDASDLKSMVSFGDLGYCCVPDDDAYKAASSQKVFNYMSYGVVPVVNEVGDLPYYVDYGRAGYVVSSDLLETLVNALRDENGRHVRGRNAQDRTSRLFLWKHHTQRIENFYEMIGNSRSGIHR